MYTKIAQLNKKNIFFQKINFQYFKGIWKNETIFISIFTNLHDPMSVDCGAYNIRKIKF